MIVTTNNSYAENIETIGNLSFLLDNDNKTASIINSVNGNKYSGSIVIPESILTTSGEKYTVTSIYESCFFNCKNLKNVTIPQTIKTIGDNSFRGCISLQKIVIPNSVDEIGTWCFDGCSSLEEVKLLAPLKTISAACFNNCTKLKNFVIPTSATTIEGHCFAGCVSLTKIDIPTTVTSIGEECFGGCTNLLEITMPSSLSYIGGWCFHGCSKLKSVVIPSGITSFKDGVFSDFNANGAIYFMGELPQNIEMTQIPFKCKIFVLDSEKDNAQKKLGSQYTFIESWNPENIKEGSISMNCEAPTISYKDGRLYFESSTNNAEFHYSITGSDIVSNEKCNNGVVELIGSYHISVYTTSEGYQPSENTNADLYWLSSNDDESNGIIQAKSRGIVVTSDGGIVTLLGLNNGELVRFYSLDGKQIGVSKVVNGIASYAASDAFVIAKFDNHSIKIAINNK